MLSHALAKSKKKNGKDRFAETIEQEFSEYLEMMLIKLVQKIADFPTLEQRSDQSDFFYKNELH